MSGSHLQGTSSSWSDVLVATGTRHGLVRVATAGVLALAVTLTGGSPFGAEALAEKNQPNSIKDDCKALGGTYYETRSGGKVCMGIPERNNTGETGEKYNLFCTRSDMVVVDCSSTPGG
jgi:hypothetical protein